MAYCYCIFNTSQQLVKEVVVYDCQLLLLKRGRQCKAARERPIVDCLRILVPHIFWNPDIHSVRVQFPDTNHAHLHHRDPCPCPLTPNSFPLPLKRPSYPSLVPLSHNSFSLLLTRFPYPSNGLLTHHLFPLPLTRSPYK